MEKEQQMKVHFCDLCNESVPQADLDQGRAFIRKGRIVCATCEGIMSHAPATGSASAQTADVAPALPVAAGAGGAQQSVSHLQPIVLRSSGGGGLWVALLGLVFTAGVMFVLDGRIQSIQRDATTAEKRIDGNSNKLALLERSAGLSDEARRETDARNDSRFDAQNKQHVQVLEAVAKLRREQEENSARLASVTVLVNKHESRAGSGDVDFQKRIDELSARLAKSEDDMNALTERVLGIENRPAVIVPVAAEPAVEKPGEPAWHARIADLKHDSNSVRWEAVTGLGATKDLATVPYLTPMLKDLDVFVRMATARVLGEMLAKSAVSNLIDALEDSETAVREAAFIALRTITGKDLKFDPQAIDAERAKRVKAWREWWKKESETPAGT
ncbi:MAG: HEAT repeat domain-containing protein [Planctomycetes bacterium]|nr:HEAT repeat domain-containing protein [Planctomycetota bacterium]